MPADEATEDAEWLSPGQLRDWAALIALLCTLPPALDAQLKRDAGMNLFEYNILVGLAEAPDGTMPMSDLALLAMGSPSRLAHAVSRLERAGYVRRTASHRAGRRTATMLTEAGREKLQRTAPGHVDEVRRLVIDVLSPEQLTALGSAARAIATSISPELVSLHGW